MLALLTGASLRLYRLTDLGLAHDEVAHWLIDRQILAGEHSVYFSAAYGHEAGQHYLEAASLLGLGDNPLALRLPAAYLGIVGLAVSYALGQRLFGRRVALLSLAILSVTFYPTFFSRLALRAISLPVLTGLSACFYWRAVAVSAAEPARRMKQPRGSAVFLAAAGLCAGLSLYTYSAARALPIFYAFFTLYGLASRWYAELQPGRLRALPRHLGVLSSRNLVLFWLTLLLTAYPLAAYLRAHPGAEYRVAEVSAPLTALRSGEWRPVAENALKIAGAFGWRGDPLWRQNVAGRPIFDPLTAMLFYSGVIYCLWKREPRHIFILLWAATATLPSLVTVDAPSTIRMIGLLPVLGLFPSLTIHSLCKLSTRSHRLSTSKRRWLWIAGLTIVVGWGFGRNLLYTFFLWPANDEVKFVWQASLTAIARALDAAPDVSPVAVLGWSPDSLDPPTLALSLRRDDLSLRYFGHELPIPMDGVILPAGGVDGALRVMRPTLRPFQPYLEERLAGWGQVNAQGDFVAYRLRVSAENLHPTTPAHILWGDELLFLGYDQPAPSQFITYWQVQRRPSAPRAIFLHAVTADGAVFSQNDGLGVPTASWQPGDIILRYHELTLPAAASVAFRLGVYNPMTQARLLTPAGQDWLEIDRQP